MVAHLIRALLGHTRNDFSAGIAADLGPTGTPTRSTVLMFKTNPYFVIWN
jgi:hypothetical protein